MSADPQEVRRQIQASLGLPPVGEETSQIAMEGYVCDFPLWLYSTRQSAWRELLSRYGEGTYARIEALKGVPSMSAPGYLDVLLFYGDQGLFHSGVDKPRQHILADSGAVFHLAVDVFVRDQLAQIVSTQRTGLP